MGSHVFVRPQYVLICVCLCMCCACMLVHTVCLGFSLDVSVCFFFVGKLGNVRVLLWCVFVCVLCMSACVNVHLGVHLLLCQSG